MRFPIVILFIHISTTDWFHVYHISSSQCRSRINTSSFIYGSNMLFFKRVYCDFTLCQSIMNKSSNLSLKSFHFIWPCTICPCFSYYLIGRFFSSIFYLIPSRSETLNLCIFSRSSRIKTTKKWDVF